MHLETYQHLRLPTDSFEEAKIRAKYFGLKR